MAHAQEKVMELQDCFMSVGGLGMQHLAFYRIQGGGFVLLHLQVFAIHSILKVNGSLKAATCVCCGVRKIHLGKSGQKIHKRSGEMCQVLTFS